MSNDWEDIGGTNATNYLFQDVIETATLNEGIRPSRFVVTNIIYLAFTWLAIGSCMAFGIKSTDKVAYITMGLPVAMLFVLFVRSVALPGASTGTSEYIGTWDWNVIITYPDVWSRAVSQVFFSLGITVSAMNKKVRREICPNAVLGPPLVWDHDYVWISLRQRDPGIRKCYCHCGVKFNAQLRFWILYFCHSRILIHD